MEEENHLNPPPKNHQKIHEFARNKQEGGSKTLVYILVAVVLLSIAFLIFGLVVLRIKAPTLRLSNVVVRDLRHTSSSLNMTMIADITLHNMNFGRFQFRGGSAALLYGNATFGAASISAGGVGGRGRRRISATVEMIIGGPPPENYMNISRDIESNLVRLMSVAELRGEIRVMKIVNRIRTASMNCSMDLNLSGQQVQGLSCQ
ncbi:late embryogenesis abundant protein At1g64065-like [Salvia miltiorrhiza]|uniref:late embryogenesis abundant protein At1g64065-like n=1 Tax=Salvia miltiorrhiza TaxID=226208 RepID=UPI0025AD59CD|nr:late embryogenesis abundant protein At1g64065-like [Salvia miltiorrhiza]